MYKKNIIVIFIAAFMCSFMISCEPQNADVDEDSGYKVLIGVSQANLIEPWRIAMHDDLLSEAKKYSDTRVIFFNAAGSSERQKSDIKKLIEIGVDLLIVSPIDPEALFDIIEKAHENIPVIAMDVRLPAGTYNLFISSEYEKIGVLTAKKINSMLGERGGRVLSIIGSHDSPPSQLISQGFESEIGKNKSIVLLPPIEGNWLRDDAEMKMKSYLLREEKPDIVFAHNDAMAHGAYIAALDYREADIKFIGVDGLKSEGIMLVEKGILEGTFFRKTGGAEAIQFAFKILNGELNEVSELILEPEPIFP